MASDGRQDDGDHTAQDRVTPARPDSKSPESASAPWAIGGGGWEFGWGPQQDDESVAAIHRALELGINWIEQPRLPMDSVTPKTVVRRALDGNAQASLRVHEGVVARRRHRPRPPQPSRRDSILREAEASLARLGCRFDRPCTRSTGPDPESDIEEGWSALAELKEQGLVKHIGGIELRPSPSLRAASRASLRWRHSSRKYSLRGTRDGSGRSCPFAGAARGIGVIRSTRRWALGCSPAQMTREAESPALPAERLGGPPRTRRFTETAAHHAPRRRLARPARGCRPARRERRRGRGGRVDAGESRGSTGAITGFRRPDQGRPGRRRGEPRAQRRRNWPRSAVSSHDRDRIRRSRARWVAGSPARLLDGNQPSYGTNRTARPR